MKAKVHPYAPMPLLSEPPAWNGGGWESVEPVELGRSALGNSINLYRANPANLLVMGGVHGDESEGIFLAHLLLHEQPAVPVIPCLNPDGALLRQRWNGHNVDLNRNLPTADWNPEPHKARYPPGAAPSSEPETRAFLSALERMKPSTVLSLHSFRESFVEIERPPETLPAEVNEAVDAFVEAAGIVRKESIGYPTPGALGAYGKDHGMLVLTYELRRGSSHGELHAILPHLSAMLERLAAIRFEG